MAFRASTAAWCSWTSVPWERLFSTTSCWSRATWPRWRSSIDSGDTSATRTSSPWLEWSTLNFFIRWLAAGTGSCAPGGGTTGTETCFSCTISVVDLFMSTMVTVTLQYQMIDHWTSEESLIIFLLRCGPKAIFHLRFGRNDFNFNGDYFLSWSAYYLCYSAPCWSRGQRRTIHRCNKCCSSVFFFCIKNELFSSTRSSDCVAVLNKVPLRMK